MCRSLEDIYFVDFASNEPNYFVVVLLSGFLKHFQTFSQSFGCFFTQFTVQSLYLTMTKNCALCRQVEDQKEALGFKNATTEDGEYLNVFKKEK